jgi:hypothetical protein
MLIFIQKEKSFPFSFESDRRNLEEVVMDVTREYIDRAQISFQILELKRKLLLSRH